VQEVQGEGGHVVVELLREAVGQAREAAHPHPHREVLTLDVAR